MSICVIFNPHAGRRRAQRRLARFLDTWREKVQMWPTERAGHGVELAQRAAEQGFRIVAAAGGDGTAHDVANGLLAVDRPDVTFAVVPIGSANDYAFTLKRQFGLAQLDDESGHAVDVGLAQSPGGRERFFVEGLGLGLCGCVTLESRKISHLQGPLLYGLAAWRAVCHHPITDLRLQWDDEPEVTYPTLMLSVLLGQREGSFRLAPEASLDDGWFNTVHSGRISRWEVAWLLPRLYFSGPPRHHPQVRHGRCRRLHVVATSPLTVHTDGEMYCTPGDGVTELQIRLLPGRMRVKVCLPR